MNDLNRSIKIFIDGTEASAGVIIRKSKCSRISKPKVHFTKRNV